MAGAAGGWWWMAVDAANSLPTGVPGSPVPWLPNMHGGYGRFFLATPLVASARTSYLSNRMAHDCYMDAGVLPRRLVPIPSHSAPAVAHVVRVARLNTRLTK